MQWTLYIPLLVGFPLSCRSKSDPRPTIGTALQEAAKAVLYTGMASTHNRGVFICQPELGGTDNWIWIQTIDKANVPKANSPPFYKTLIEVDITLHLFPINVAVLMLL